MALPAKLTQSQVDAIREGIADTVRGLTAEQWRDVGIRNGWILCANCGEPADIKSFSTAEVGEEAYTWENVSHGDWGDYGFETECPDQLYDAPLTITRKRWRLVEVVTYDLPEYEPDGPIVDQVPR
jgi:hypothetical protein